MKKTIIPDVSFYECRILLRNLYKYFLLHADEHVKQLAPNGWQNSPYFQFLNKTIEEHYADYKYLQENSLLSMQTDKEIPNRPGEYYRRILDKTDYSLDEFIDNKAWFVAEPSQEFIVIFFCVSSFITRRPKCDVYRDKKDLLWQMNSVIIDICLAYDQVGRDFSKDEAYIEYAVQLFFRRYEEYGYSILPFLELFFKACRKAGWDWMYLNMAISCYPSLIDSLHKLSQVDPEDHEQYRLLCIEIDFLKKKLGFVDYIPTEEEMLDREKAQGVPETVTSFKNVYGYYPEYYPPKFSKD